MTREPMRPAWLWWLLSIGLLSCVALSRLIEPSPAGLGSHVQLGLSACPFHRLFRLPCPACGLTTSFAHLTRGSFGRAVEANVVGPWALLWALALGLYFAWLAASGEAEMSPRAQRRIVTSFALLCAFACAAWGVRLGCALL